MHRRSLANHGTYPRPKTWVTTFRAAESHDDAMAPVKDGTNWNVTTTKAMDTVRTALGLVLAVTRPVDEHVTPTRIQRTSVTARTNTIHMNAEPTLVARDGMTKMGAVLTATTAIMVAIAIAAVTDHGRAVAADDRRVTR